MTTANLVETTWLTRHPRTTEITYDQGSEFIGHEFGKYFIQEEYGIKSKPILSENPNYIVMLEIIHKALGNLVRAYNIQDNYIDKDDPWMGTLEATAFTI